MGGGILKMGTNGRSLQEIHGDLVKEDDKSTTFFHKMVNAIMEGIF